MHLKQLENHTDIQLSIHIGRLIKCVYAFLFHDIFIFMIYEWKHKSTNPESTVDKLCSNKIITLQPTTYYVIINTPLKDNLSSTNRNSLAKIYYHQIQDNKYTFIQ